MTDSAPPAPDPGGASVVGHPSSVICHPSPRFPRVIDPPGRGSEDEEGGPKGEKEQYPGHGGGVAHLEVHEGAVEHVEGIEGGGVLRAAVGHDVSLGEVLEGAD